MRRFLTQLAGITYLGAMYLSIPVMPLLASLVFWRRTYVMNYARTVRKTAVHVAAMRKGPAMHYFQDV